MSLSKREVGSPILPPPAMKVSISIKNQELVFVDDQKNIIKSWSVSTSRFGVGEEKGSNKTPLGNFKVFEKIGDGLPIHTIFKTRKPVGVWNMSLENKEDLVLTRIIWLEGIEVNNKNTQERFIYIHGTNHEELIGTSASCGCIRMKNLDIIDLYNCISQEVEITIA